MAVSLPYDSAAALGLIDWRRDFEWPLRPRALADAFAQSFNAYSHLARSHTDGFAQRVLLAAPVFLGHVFGLFEKALILSSKYRGKTEFVSAAADFRFLKGEQVDLRSLAAAAASGTNAPTPRYPTVRSLRNTVEWTPFFKLPSAFLFPDVTAISKNELLVDVAASSTQRTRYQDAASILSCARSRAPSDVLEVQDIALSVSRAIVEILLAAVEVEDPISARLGQLIEVVATQVLRQATADLRALESLPVVPNVIWSGTAGKYAPRIVGIEGMRRGGDVVRFDHGGTCGLITLFEPIALIELSASSRFVMATPALVDVAKPLLKRQELAVRTTPKLESGQGFPMLRRLRLDAPSSKRLRRRVMYLAGAIFSHRKNPTHSIGEMVYTDWSLRLALMLAQLPADFVCKPHPDSFRAGPKHPLEAIAPVERRPFEAVMDDADIYVYDIVNSTTFWEAVCTRRLIVFIDLGIAEINPLIRPIFNKRCRVINATYDARNLPRIDERDLAEAVLGGPDSADPSDFRALFLSSHAHTPPRSSLIGR